MNLKKVLATGLAMATAIGCLTACGGTKTAGLGSNISKEAKQAIKDGKVVISVPAWPAKDAKNYEKMEATRKEFMEKYPDIYVEGDPYSFALNTFTAVASGGELPTMYNTWYTQIESIINNGYAADITEALEKAEFREYMSEDLLQYTSDENGKIYAFTTDAYNQGLYINKKLFKEAGLVNEDGSIKVPETYDDILEFSKTIREKTGKAGFAFPNADNCGGWNFINVAWSYGANFVEKGEDGKYTAAFETPEMKAALQWYADMKKADAFPTGVSTIGQEKMKEIFATHQAAMMFSNPPNSGLASTYGMSPEDILVVRMPAGPEGRYSQLGGNVYMFRADVTPEQLDACMKWLEFTGKTPRLTDENAQKIKDSNQATLDENGIVLTQEAFTIWNNPEREEKIKEIYAEHTNVNAEDYASYFEGEDVTIRPEPEVACQELYAILDGMLQSVIADADADLDALIKDAAHQWQTNYLNNLE